MILVETETMRACTKCGTEYPATLEFFYAAKRVKSGLDSWCKTCAKAHQRGYKRKRRNQHPECIKANAVAFYKRHSHRLNKQKRAYRRTINGHLHEVFSGMKQRCNNSKRWNYSRYGGRGIKNLFESANEFIGYVTSELQVDPRGLQIDRIDNNGHYEPGNIRFVTAKENCNNRNKRG